MKLCRFCIVLMFVFALTASAQNTPWTSSVRGSWVQTGPAAAGDVTLATKDTVAQIVVADDEGANVHQAAEFLAGDIEKISGHKPAIVKSATRAAASHALHGEDCNQRSTRTRRTRTPVAPIT